MLDQEGIKKAFHLARNGDLSALRALDLTGFSSPGLTDPAGAGIIHHAARSGNSDILKYLIVEKALPGSAKSYVGATPAHDAAATGCLNSLQWLLDHTDCTVSDTDQSGATVTHLAARYGHLMVLKWLVTQAGAPLTLKTDSGALPLHFAAARGDLDTVKFLVEQKSRTINSQMSCGSSACYLAAQEGHLEVLKYLVEEGGASLRLLSYDGMSCLHSAAQTGKLEIVKWLVTQHKMSPNERDFDGATTIHFAAGRGHPVVLDWLLENGAKITVDNLGGSPLHDAAEHGRLHLEALKSLLGSGRTDQHSMGVVIYGSSAYHSIMQCVRILLKYGCDPSIRDNNGLTAADLAENCWHRACAATLRRRLTKGVNGNFVPVGRERASVQNFFDNGNTNLKEFPSDSDGSGSDYVDLDNGSISSSFYMIHTSQLWRAPAGISARNFNSETGEMTDGSSPSSTYQRPGYLTIPPPPESPPPPVPEKQHSPVKRNGKLFPAKKRLPDYENIDPNLQIPKSQVQGLMNRSKPVLARYQPGGTVHVNDENGEVYVRMGPGTESIPESSGGSDLHVIREESFTEPNTPDPDTKDAPANAFDIPPAPPPPPINGNGNKTPTGTLTPTAPPAPPPPPPLPSPQSAQPSSDSGRSSRASSFSTSSMPRNINLAELKAKFSGLRPALRPASPGQQTPNVDLIAELKSGNWTASLKKTKKKKPVEENKENELKEPKTFWKDLQRVTTMSPKKVPQKRDRSPSDKLVGKYDPKNYINKVPLQDASGNELPQWKRLLIAKQFAEKELTEDEEWAAKQEEERRFKDMPGWKRAILEKKEAENRAKKEREEQDIAAIEWAKRNPTQSESMALDEDGLPMTPWQAELRERKDSKSSHSDRSRPTSTHSN